jgi:hypothetical protein
MSHEVKYIEMDGHKEAIVIAVLNGSGKLVMETVIETEANYPNEGKEPVQKGTSFELAVLQ